LKEKWNWGAFLLPPFWAAAMNLWGWFAAAVVCLLVIPFAFVGGLFVACYLGAKGNELAWTSRRWDSVEQFRATQAAWSKAGILLTAMSCLFSIIIILLLGYFS